MPPARRPSPLSDEVCMPSPAPVLLGAPNNVLGATNYGVKNTFVDVPSGLTPASMKNWREPMMTAPAGLGKKMGCFQAPVPETAPTSGKIGQAPASITPVATPQGNTGFHYVVTTPTSSAPGAHPGHLNAGAVAYTPTPVAYTPTPYTPGPFTSAPTTPGSAGAAGASVATSAAGGLQESMPMWNASRVVRPVASTQVGKVAWEQVTDEAGEAENDGDSEEDSEDGIDNDVPLQLRNPEHAPKAPPGALHPSIGSEGHAMGVCKRCCFFPRGRCANGYECEFCHYEHDKRKRKNKKKRTIRARQGYGNGTTRLLLAKELMRSPGGRSEPIGGRPVITVPAAAMERRPGMHMANGSCMAQGPLLFQNGASAFQPPAGQVAAWLGPSQQFLGYYQTADAGIPRPQLAAAGTHAGQQQVLVYSNALGGQQLSAAHFGMAAPAQAMGTAAACACPFGSADSVQLVVQNPQQASSHMIMLPPAMSQAAAQGPQALQPQRYCEPPPPPMQSPRLQLGLPGSMMPQR